MSEFNDWNQRVVAEFRANEGRVGGSFEGAPMILVHHVGRKSGKDGTGAFPKVLIREWFPAGQAAAAGGGLCRRLRLALVRLRGRCPGPG